MALDKVRKNVQLPHQVLDGVRDFYKDKYRLDKMIINETEIFKQLKPRLKIQIFDYIFEEYYDLFAFTFEDCDLEFKRELLANCNFRHYQHQENDENDDKDDAALNYQMEESPIIEHANQMSKRVHFIISGQIYLMNREGMYEYGIIHEGSYFGDLSLLLNYQNEFSYHYNPFSGKPVQMLSIAGDVFLGICNKYPLSKEIFMKRALKKKVVFQDYKNMTLLKYMKTIIGNPKIITDTSDENMNIYNRVMKMKEMDIKIELFRSLLFHYKLNQYYAKRLKQDVKIIKKARRERSNIF